MDRDLSSSSREVHQYQAAMKHPAYLNITESIVVLCKRSQSLKYPRYTYNYGLWTAAPSISSIIVYSVIIPVVSTFGIVGNTLILAVHYKRNVKASVYTYLAVLAASDLVTCILLLFSSLARGVFRCQSGWMEFDMFVHFPIGSITSNITVWAALGVSVDRLIIVYSNMSRPQCKSPRFCNRQIARRLMIFSFCFAILINVPYWFMYKYNERGDLVTTYFFHSRWYNLHNWLQFVIFGLIPAIFLLIANGVMCYSVRKILTQRQMLLKRKDIREGNRLRDQARLTIMLIGIVFVFIVGELPTHLASRRSALTLLYGGDLSKVQEVFMERFRMWATLLNAIASSANFIFYCLLSPCFLVHLKRVLMPETGVVRRNAKAPIAYLRQQTCDNDKCEIFVL